MKFKTNENVVAFRNNNLQDICWHKKKDVSSCHC